MDVSQILLILILMMLIIISRQVHRLRDRTTKDTVLLLQCMTRIVDAIVRASYWEDEHV